MIWREKEGGDGGDHHLPAWCYMRHRGRSQQALPATMKTAQKALHCLLLFLKSLFPPPVRPSCPSNAERENACFRSRRVTGLQLHRPQPVQPVWEGESLLFMLVQDSIIVWQNGIEKHVMWREPSSFLPVFLPVPSFLPSMLRKARNHAVLSCSVLACCFCFEKEFTCSRDIHAASSSLYG